MKTNTPKDLIGASATPLVLSILAREESYGYAIIQKVKELSRGKLEWTDGMLYPILHRLEKQKLIQSIWKDAPTGRKRKYYRIRAAGKEKLLELKKHWNQIYQTLELSWT
jgi:DNA-binding PadR family transcriptional regulator